MAGPLRIVSLVSSATEMLYALGLGDWVVAVSHECDYPAEVAQKPRVTRTSIDGARSSRDIDTQVRALATTGSPLYEIDADLLAELAPNLIVTQAQCDVCAVPYADVLQLVTDRQEFKHTRIVALDPQSLEDVLAELVQVGEAAGRREEALRTAAEMKGRIEMVSSRCEHVASADRPRTCIIEWIEPIMLAGNWAPQLMQLAGGARGLTEPHQQSQYAEWEQVRDYDPQLVVIAPCGFDLGRTLEEAERLTSLPGWSSVAAVQSGRVFAVDGTAYFNRPGPRLVDSLEMLAHFVHPELAPQPTRAAEGTAWQRLA